MSDLDDIPAQSDAHVRRGGIGSVFKGVRWKTGFGIARPISGYSFYPNWLSNPSYSNWFADWFVWVCFTRAQLRLGTAPYSQACKPLSKAGKDYSSMA